MKRFLISLSILFLCILSTIAAIKGDVNGDGKVTIADATALIDFVANNAKTYTAEQLLSAADMDGDGNITMADVNAVIDIILNGGSVDDVDALYITFHEDGDATYEMPSAWKSYVTVSIDGNNVVVTNTNETQEYTTYLSGKTTNGSYAYVGVYKTSLVLNGVDITSTSGAAINIASGKRTALILADGTQNTLVDATGGEQKAALYCKGHLEISDAGSLSVTGNSKHAIAAKEYILLKRTTGTITVAGSASDGIHTGGFFKMNGGTLQVANVTGDGVQAEMLLDGSADDGKLLINGGSITVNVSATDVAALKADSTLQILDGTLTLTTTGNCDKAIKTKGDVVISGGQIGITQSGTYVVSGFTDTTTGTTTYDAAYVTAIKADGSLTVNDGTITINNTADGGKGLSADGNINIAGGNLILNANGAGGVLDTTGANITEGAGEEPVETKSYRLYVAIPTSDSSSSGGMGGPGQQTSGTAWSNVYLYSVNGTDSTLVATLTQQASIAGSDGTTTTFFYYDFAEPTSGTYCFKSDNYKSSNTGGMGGPGQQSSGTYSIATSSFSINLTGSDVYYQITGSYTSTSTSSSGGMGGWGGNTSSGGKRTYTINDVTSTYSGGTVAASEGDTYSAACIKSDADVTLSGGTITMEHTGTISKGIKADGVVTLSGTEITDTAGGTYLIVGTDPSYCTSVKCGSYVGTAGGLEVTASGSASRGISSEGTLDISGGTYNMTLSGDGTTFTSNSTTDGCASIGIKSDADMQLLAGNITINCTAKGGKGIKVGTSSLSGANGARLTIGEASADNSLLHLNVSTSGAYLATESSSSSWGGGPGGGGPMDAGYIGSPKAVKVMGAITVNSGTIYLSTTSDAGEGLESKYTITFNGSIFESNTYDDAINAANQITFNDGYIWAHASGNDGIDSNGSGFVFNGGVILASGTNAPEEGFDCDQENFVINGGVLIGTGGATSSVTSAKQPYSTLSSVSTTANTYISIKNASGTVLHTYKLPNTVSSATILVSSPLLTSGSSATLVYGSTAISNPTESVWDGVYTTGATLTGGSTKSFTPSTK